MCGGRPPGTRYPSPGVGAWLRQNGREDPRKEIGDMATIIYVGNLPANASESQVRDLFEQYGPVHSVEMVADDESGEADHFAFVGMDREDAEVAIEELDGVDLEGHPLQVNEAGEASPPDDDWDDVAWDDEDWEEDQRPRVPRRGDRRDEDRRGPRRREARRRVGGRGARDPRLPE